MSSSRRWLGGSALWAGLEAGLSASLSFVSAFAVARMIGPEEVGVGAAAVAVHVLLWVAVNALFADSLVQRSAVSHEDASSAFWAAIGVGVAASCVEVGLGPALRASLGDSRLLPMSALLAMALPLVGAGGAVQGVLTRDRQYRTLAARAVLGQGFGTLTGIGCALAGMGAWALVFQQAVTSAAGALALLFCAGWRPALVLRWPSVRALLRVGGPLTLSTLVQQGRYRLFAVLIGGTAGPAALGQVHMAFRLIDTVRELASTALWRLMLPLMARRQHDLAALQACLDDVLRRSALLLFPVIGGLLLVAQPAVALLLGPAWRPAAEAATPLVALMALVFLSFPGGVAMVARGQPRFALLANIMSTALAASGVLLLRPETPGAAGWIWFAAQAAVLPYSLLMTARVMHTVPLRQWRAGVPALLLAAAATAAAWSLPAAIAGANGPAWLAASRLSVAALVYLATAFFIFRNDIWERARLIRPRAMEQ